MKNPCPIIMKTTFCFQGVHLRSKAMNQIRIVRGRRRGTHERGTSEIKTREGKRVKYHAATNIIASCNQLRVSLVPLTSNSSSTSYLAEIPPQPQALPPHPKSLATSRLFPHPRPIRQYFNLHYTYHFTLLRRKSKNPKK